MNRTIVSIAVAVLLIGAGYFLGRLHGDVERRSLARAVEALHAADSLRIVAQVEVARYRFITDNLTAQGDSLRAALEKKPPIKYVIHEVRDSLDRSVHGDAAHLDLFRTVLLRKPDDYRQLLGADTVR